MFVLISLISFLNPPATKNHNNIITIKMPFLNPSLTLMAQQTSGMFVLISSMSFLIPPAAYPVRCGLLITTLLVQIHLLSGDRTHH